MGHLEDIISESKIDYSNSFIARRVNQMLANPEEVGKDIEFHSDPAVNEQIVAITKDVYNVLSRSCVTSEGEHWLKCNEFQSSLESDNNPARNSYIISLAANHFAIGSGRLIGMDLEGLQIDSSVVIPEGVQVYNANNTPTDSSIGEQLPSSIQSVQLSGTRVDGSIELPDTVEEYSAINTPTGDNLKCPRNLKKLMLDNTTVTGDIELNEGLQVYSCVGTDTTSDIDLPRSLIAANLNSTRVDSSLAVPTRVQYLNVADTDVDENVHLPSGLLGLEFKPSELKGVRLPFLLEKAVDDHIAVGFLERKWTSAAEYWNSSEPNMVIAYEDQPVVRILGMLRTLQDEYFDVIDYILAEDFGRPSPDAELLRRTKDACTYIQEAVAEMAPSDVDYIRKMHQISGAEPNDARIDQHINRIKLAAGFIKAISNTISALSNYQDNTLKDAIGTDFSEYAKFMRLIGIPVDSSAKSFSDCNILEKGNPVSSLNLTLFVEQYDSQESLNQSLMGSLNNKTFAIGRYDLPDDIKNALYPEESGTENCGVPIRSLFVKFYGNHDKAKKDITIQNLLADSRQINPAQQISLVDNGLDNLVKSLTTMKRDRLANMQSALSSVSGTCQESDPESTKVNYCLVTEAVEGITFERYIESSINEFEIQQRLRQLVDNVIEFQNHANEVYANDEEFSELLQQKDYSAHLLSVFGINSQRRELTPAQQRFSIALTAVGNKLNQYMADERCVSFVHGDMHLRNALLIKDGSVKVFDFERSSYALRAEDLVRMYVTASSYKLGEEIKEHYFKTAFGDQYDSAGFKEEAETMFELATAAYYIENMEYYLSEEHEGASTSERKIFHDKKLAAKRNIRANLEKHFDDELVSDIVDHIMPENGEYPVAREHIMGVSPVISGVPIFNAL